MFGFLIIFLEYIFLSNIIERKEVGFIETIFQNLIEQYGKLDFLGCFEAASAPEVVSTDPMRGSKAVPVYAPVIINFNRDMKEVKIIISGMAGDVEATGRTATYKPHTVFMPGKNYEVTVHGKSVTGEEMEPYSFNFSTVDMGDKLWVEVNLRLLQKVVVYRGDRAIKSMLASGGLPGPENETPLGFFTIKNRGESFWSEKFKEGALYWVRIKDDYLFHSVPRDAEGNIIEEEHRKLGLPASHGCIRLRDDDAKWFYENVPDGTMVVIHE
ncbi:MAG: L,D-transpeptidase family protein [Tepidanaerobacteraceae bacterium]|nr:L,D-transpeptidase family protein [Tepidanaerobacteraceae bacterium]